MTTRNLFPDDVATRDAGDAGGGVGPTDRWVLHRAGILNVWQYDRVELAFAGGRLLLRGKNGAGKSKALEVLLPFLLDGDTRQLDATGRDRTTVSWLMTDGRPNGHHIGYVWLELRCDDGGGGGDDPDGEDRDGDGPRYLTLGAGLKASTATRRADSWFFLTPRRVGVDLQLEVAGECLSAERLKEAVGEEAVTASGAEHRRRVGRRLFGLFDEARYRNLLHLLHRLRDPNIGNRVEAGELANVLTDALPPIDERVLAEAAGHFDDLDAIRDQVDRSGATATALGQFLGAYRGYTRAALARRAVAVEEADRTRSRAERATRRFASAVEESAEAARRAEATLAAERQRRTSLEGERRELERSEGYRAHQDLADRQERVAALAAAARVATSAAERARAAHGRAEADLAAAQGELLRSASVAAQGAATVAGLAAEAGMDPTLLGPQPTPGAGGDVDGAEVARAEERSRGARTLVDGRRRRAVAVRARAQEAERAGQEARRADEQAAASEAEVDRERAGVAAAREAKAGAEAAWAGAVEVWTGSGLAAGLGVRWDPVHARLADREGEPTWEAAVRAAAVAALAPPLQQARHRAAATEVAVSVAGDALASVQARLADVEAETEARPEPARWRQADRDPAGGVPFYELVDIAPGVDAGRAAALEAALEASGLLDAWVTADGIAVHPDTLDTVLRADAPPCPDGTPTLADVLVPAPAEQGPVGPDTVGTLLRAVALDPHAGAATWVTPTGRWSLGLLQGAWRKPTVEFLGAAARRATRERLLAELRSEVAHREGALAEARQAAETASAHRDAVEALPRSLPAAEAVEDAARELRVAERALAAARARHDADRRRAEAARATANRLVAAVAHEAAGDGLPTGVADLDTVLAALGELRDLLADHGRALRDVSRDLARVQRCRHDEAERGAEASEATAEAGQRRAEHDGAAHDLAALREALSATVEAVLAQHRSITEALVDLDDTVLPAAEGAVHAAVTERATAAAHLEEARTAEAGARRALAEAGEALASVVVLPGVMLAATGRDVVSTADLVALGPPPPDAVDLAAALAAAVAPLVDGDHEVTDGTILSRYDRLSEALAEGYDTAIDEHHGVKVVHVADDSGRQPLAAVAARMAEEAEAARKRLAAREREVLERFLLRELADEVRVKLLDAHDLVAGTNRTLGGVRTSHGKGAHLEWRLRDDASAPAGVAARLLVDELRDEEADARLREALLALIEAEKAADPSASYEQHLRAALDYRAWHRFTVKVTDAAQPGSGRVLSNRLGLSQGEQRVLSYLALFAAAASHFEAIARDAPDAPRLLLLDDAFAKVDEPTHAQLLGLLVDLGLDFVVTSERMWGCFPTVPSLEIYEAVRDPAHPGVALVHFRWDGHRRHLVGV